MAAAEKEEWCGVKNIFVEAKTTPIFGPCEILSYVQD